MPAERFLPCPRCGQSDRVEKVSAIYLHGLSTIHRGARNHPDSSEEQVSRAFKIGINEKELQALSSQLAPPSSGRKQATRLVHPDLILLAFSAVLPVFLAGIATSQRGLLLPVIAIVLLFYGLYVWQRPRLVARFEQQRAAQRAENEQVKAAIQRWMNASYCARDRCVFEAGTGRCMGVDNFHSFLSGQ